MLGVLHDRYNATHRRGRPSGARAAMHRVPSKTASGSTSATTTKESAPWPGTKHPRAPPKPRSKRSRKQIAALTAKLNAARRKAAGREVPDYTLWTLAGEVRLSSLFAGADRLLAIHNMGHGCRYCTLWADGFNAFLPHLESAMAVALLSRDDPETQRRFANSRGWRFRLASHRGGDYIREQSAGSGHDNMPGAVLYEKQGRQDPAQERRCLRTRRHVLLGLEPARDGRARGGGLDASVQLLAADRRSWTTAAETCSTREGSPWRTTVKSSSSATWSCSRARRCPVPASPTRPTGVFPRAAIG